MADQAKRRVLDHDATRMSLQGFDGRVAVVTGAARGIGRRVVETFVALGAQVAGLDLDEPEIEGALGVVVDVTDPQSIAAGVERTEAELGPVSILVTSAGIFNPTDFENVSLDLWRRTLEVNATGTFNCVQAVLPGMSDRDYGRVVTLASMAGVDGGARACAHYATSKGAVIAFTKAIAKEYCSRGITANVVAPRNIRSGMIAAFEDELVAQAPMGRVGEADDVAAAVAYLSSAHASFMTGSVITLNGGWW